jgi:hypothetical protein
MMASSNATAVLNAMSVEDEPQEPKQLMAYALLKVLENSGTDGSEATAVGDVVGQLEGIIGAGFVVDQVREALSEWENVPAA